MPKLHPYPTISLKEARLAGYKALTYTYTPDEYIMMDRVIRDMKKGRRPIDFAIVVEDDKQPNKLAVYRKNSL